MISIQIVTISGISYGLKAQFNPAQGNAYKCSKPLLKVKMVMLFRAESPAYTSPGQVN